MCFQSITLLITNRPSFAHYHLIRHPNLDILQSYEMAVGTTPNQLDIAYHLFNSSCKWAIKLHHRLSGDQPILCQRRSLRIKLVSAIRLPCDPNHTTQCMVLALGSTPMLLIPQFGHVMVETFLWPESVLLDPCRLWVRSDESSLSHID